MHKFKDVPVYIFNRQDRVGMVRGRAQELEAHTGILYVQFRLALKNSLSVAMQHKITNLLYLHQGLIIGNVYMII